MTEINLQTFLHDLPELRRRLLSVAAAFFSFFIPCLYYSNPLLTIILHPLSHVLKTHQNLITTQVSALVVIPLEIAIDTACLCTLPVLLFQIWQFISPGLYRKEQKLARHILLFGFILFITGLLFCFYVILPFMFKMLIQFTPQDVIFLPDIAHAMHFIIRFLFMFGIFFQIPLISFLLVRFHYLTLETLKSIRPYAIVSAFTLGMLLTPPDVLSQLILAIPLCLLYELGILLAKKCT